MPVGCAVMNTAVPSTRVGGLAATAAANSSSGNARAVSRSATSRRPVFQVVINVKMSAAITSGSQPPCRILNALPATYDTSMVTNTRTNAATTGTDHRHRMRPTTGSSVPVINIVSATAMPYAAASAAEDLNPITMSTQLMARNQFTCGT